MNILEAEILAEKAKPSYSYLVATIKNEEKEYKEHIGKYTKLLQQISYAKLETDITGYEDVIVALKESNEFFDPGMSVILYKYGIKDEDIEECERIVKDNNELIKAAEKIIIKIKEDTEI